MSSILKVSSLTFCLGIFWLFFFPKHAVAQSMRDSLLSHAATAIDAGAYQQAIDALNLLPGIDDSALFQPDQAEALQLLSRSYNALGDKKKAYRYFERYRLLKDSLFSLEKNTVISRLEKNYQAEKKDKEIAHQQILLKRNEVMAFRKNLVIRGGVTGGLLLLLLCIISLGNYRKKQKINKKIREQMQHSNEIEQLQAHIKGTAEERRKISYQLQQNVYPVIRQASGILKDLEEKDASLNLSEPFSETRQIMGQVKKSLDDICLSHEEEMHTKQLSSALQAFLDNVPIKYGLNITFNYRGQETLLPGTHVLHLKRIVQELVQNVIKHSGATDANIYLKYAPGSLILSVSDNGKGFGPDRTGEQGMGLTNIKERLDAIKGSMTVEQVQGTLITIVVPLYQEADAERSC